MMIMREGQLKGFVRMVLGFSECGIANTCGAQGKDYGCKWEDSQVGLHQR